MTRDEKLQHAKAIARYIAAIGGPDFTGLADDELLSRIENIVADFSEAIVEAISNN